VRDDLQRAGLSIIELDVAEVGALQLDRGIQDLFEHQLKLGGDKEPRAQLIQASHRGEIGIQPVLQSQQFRLRPLALGDVLEIHRDAP
jgi:hypothetical protein